MRQPYKVARGGATAKVSIEPNEDPVSEMDTALLRSCAGIHRPNSVPIDGYEGPSQSPITNRQADNPFAPKRSADQRDAISTHS